VRSNRKRKITRRPRKRGRKKENKHEEKGKKKKKKGKDDDAPWAKNKEEEVLAVSDDVNDLDAKPSVPVDESPNNSAAVEDVNEIVSDLPKDDIKRTKMTSEES